MAKYSNLCHGVLATSFQPTSNLISEIIVDSTALAHYRCSRLSTTARSTKSATSVACHLDLQAPADWLSTLRNNAVGYRHGTWISWTCDGHSIASLVCSQIGKKVFFILVFVFCVCSAILFLMQGAKRKVQCARAVRAWRIPMFCHNSATMIKTIVRLVSIALTASQAAGMSRFWQLYPIAAHTDRHPLWTRPIQFYQPRNL